MIQGPTTQARRLRYGPTQARRPRYGFHPDGGMARVQRFMLRSKIHRATLTGTDVEYEGSIAIDRLLIDAAQLLPGEQVHVLNVNNGARLVTYVIEAAAGSGVMLLNGPAARLAVPGDKVVVLSYSAMTDEEARTWRPIVVFVDEKNRQT